MKKILRTFALTLCLFVLATTGKAQATYGYNETEGFFGIPDENASSLVLYPNPVRSQTRVAFPELTRNTVKVDILDLSGRSLQQATYAPGIYQLEIDMSMLAGGLYTVRVMEKGQPIRYIKVFKDQL